VLFDSAGYGGTFILSAAVLSAAGVLAFVTARVTGRTG
jgi:hypothetical protein